MASNFLIYMQAQNYWLWLPTSSLLERIREPFYSINPITFDFSEKKYYDWLVIPVIVVSIV